MGPLALEIEETGDQCDFFKHPKVSRWLKVHRGHVSVHHKSADFFSVAVHMDREEVAAKQI